MEIAKVSLQINYPETNTGLGLIDDIKIWFDSERGAFVAKPTQIKNPQEIFWIGFGASRELAVTSLLDTRIALIAGEYNPVKQFATTTQTEEEKNAWAGRIYVTREELDLGLSSVLQNESAFEA